MGLLEEGRVGMQERKGMGLLPLKLWCGRPLAPGSYTTSRYIQSLHEPIIVFRPHKMYIGSLEITKIMRKKLSKSFESESGKWEYISNSVQL